MEAVLCLLLLMLRARLCAFSCATEKTLGGGCTFCSEGSKAPQSAKREARPQLGSGLGFRAQSGRRHTNTMGTAAARDSTIASAKAPCLCIYRVG